ncbi:uncharacterized protein TNCV_2498151 [Trichonephila clavipes]|nr:uncharacterized protein TNCV_2498151 [Trichonephila clavipes]
MRFKILLPNQRHFLAAMVGKDGKIYFRLVDVGTLLGQSNVYKFTKRFDTLVIQGKDVLPVHKSFPVMTQKSKLVTPDVVFNILNAELSSLVTSFTTSLNAGVALVEGNLMVESYKLSPVLHVQDSSVPRSVLVRKWVQDFIEKVMRRTVAPVECPAEPWIDFLVNEVEVSSRIPTLPLITRCNKSIQTDPPTFISNPLERRPLGTLFCWCPTIILFTLGNDGVILHSSITDTEKRIVELLTKVLLHHHPLDIPCFRAFASFEPKDVSSDYLEQEASKGKGAFIQALWTLYAKSNLYRLAYKAWKRHGPQNLTTWTLLAQAVLDGCYEEKWPDTVFQVSDVCPICLSPMHWPEKTHCGHVFHLRCLLQNLDVSNTCPLFRASIPLRTS